VHGLGQVHTGEHTLGEHHAFGVQPAEILIAKVVTFELSIYPLLVGVGHGSAG
jgi:hypothetical protein